MTRRVTAKDVARKNFSAFMEHGPGLRYSTGIFIIARCRNCNRLLYGGLGGMGVGQMWGERDKRYSKLPGYRHAPDQKCDECLAKTGRTRA